MKKLLALAFITMLCIACSVEEETTPNEDTNLEVVLENYKGVFTTVDGQTRGILDVTVAEDNLSASGTLTLSTGEIIMIDTDQITDLGNRKELTFTSNDLSFTMTTGEEEEIMEIDTATFRGAESAILVGQNTQRAPLDPVLGTYVCLDCPEPLNNMLTQTFNLIISAADMSGNSTITSQTALGGTIYNGVATQSGCVVSGGQTTCNLTSGTTPGMVGTAFNPGGGPVIWSGTHTFDNGPSGPNDCSTVSGTWSWNASTIGTVGGNFTSTSSGDCPPPPVTLLFEGFDNAIGTAPVSGYVVRDVNFGGEPTDANVIEFNLNRSDPMFPVSADYFGRVQASELNNSNPAISIGNIQGTRFFGIQDADSTTAPANPNGNTDNLTVNWFNIDVSSVSTMTVSAFFAENQGPAGQWDADHVVQLQWSTDNTSWTPFFGIAAEQPGGDTTNTNAKIDADLNGIGEGTTLTNVLTEFTSNSVDVSSINTISVRIIMSNFSSGQENVVFDNVTISGF